MAKFKKINIPGGEKIIIKEGKMDVPDNPIIPFIEGTEQGLTSGMHLSWSLIRQ
jgi:isocitrate dehydrogenase